MDVDVSSDFATFLAWPSQTLTAESFSYRYRSCRRYADQKDQHFRLALDRVSKGGDRLFNLNVTSKDKAEQLLHDNAIAGYIVVESPIAGCQQPGLNQNIIKVYWLLFKRHLLLKQY